MSTDREKARLAVKASRKKTKETNYLRYKSIQFRSNWRRRAKENGVSPDTVPQSKEILKWLESKVPLVCEYTGELLSEDNFGVDHRVSVFKGGGFSLENLAITSLKINGAKGDLSEEEFRQLLNLVQLWEDKGVRLLRRLVWSNSMFSPK